MKVALGIDYDEFITSPVAFEYERMMTQTGYSHAEIARIQGETKVGNTPLFELRNLTEGAPYRGAGERRHDPGQDEAANAPAASKLAGLRSAPTRPPGRVIRA